MMSLTLRWGPAELTLRSGRADVLDWARDCFAAQPGPGPAAVSASGTIVVDDDLAGRLGAACTEPLPGSSGLPGAAGAADGMTLVRVTVPAAGGIRSWPATLVFGQAAGEEPHAFCTGDELAPRAGELLARQLLERHLRAAGTTVLHAAGAVLDGQALLFVGPGGSGKTTLATWAAAAGGGEFLAGDRAGAFISGSTGLSGAAAVAVGYGVSTRFGPGTLRALLGTDDWLDRIPLPGLNKMLGAAKTDPVGSGPFKLVLTNAELAALGLRTASAAPLAGIVILEAAPSGTGPEVIRVPAARALGPVRPHLRQSWYVLPAAGQPPGDPGYGNSPEGLAALLEQVPVAAARWRLGRDDPAELLGKIRGCLSEPGASPAPAPAPG